MTIDPLPNLMLRNIHRSSDVPRVAGEVAAKAADLVDKMEPGRFLEVATAVDTLKAGFDARGLSADQTRTALLVAGSLVGGAGGPILDTVAKGLGGSLNALTDQAVEVSKAAAGTPLEALGAEVGTAIAQGGGHNAPLVLFMAGAVQGAVNAPPDPNNPQAGIRCGSILRPDPLFADKTQMVVNVAKTPGNPNGLAEVPLGKYQTVSLDQLFTGKDEVVIGFGKPNVFTAIPRNGGKGGYEKLDAFMFFRKEARMASASYVQTGVYLRPRNLPPQAAADLRTAMDLVLGKRSISCASANAKTLTAAGFTSDGKAMNHIKRPMTLFLRIVEHGMEYKGKKVDFDIINTTTDTIDQHFRSVFKKEASSPYRAITKSCSNESSKVSAADMKAMRENQAAAPKLELETTAGGPTLQIRNSRPGVIGSALRWLWGAHVMWEALPDQTRVDIDKYLPDTLADKFSEVKKLKAVDKIKSKMFSPGKIKVMRKLMAKTFDKADREFTPDQVAKMFKIPGPGEKVAPNKDGRIMYNFVICGKGKENRIVVTRLNVEKKLPDWVLSKHVLISGYDPDPRFAGEMWAERYTKKDGTEGVRIHLNNNSGTYRPTAEQTLAAAEYLKEVFKGVEVVGHPMGADDFGPGADLRKTEPTAAEPIR